jgi:ATP-binding cassette subfamily F protein uup
VQNFSATIMRGDKVGLIGMNGAGKTTLLRMILGEDQPDSGEVRQGSRMQIAYFDQMRAQLDDEMSLADTISPGSDWVEVGGQRKHVMTYLADFLFSPERARSPVKSLSGGERNRLLLARLFARPANVLVLDEPTNDLDIDTLELLEQLLEDFNGTVFLVSHDRAFLDNVVTQVLVAEGEGAWCEYVGGYADWERVRKSSQDLKKNKNEVKAVSSTTPTASTQAVANPSKPKKLSFKEQRELEGLPALIESLEREQNELNQLLADGQLFAQDHVKAAQLGLRIEAIESELMLALQRWETLGNR